MAHSITSYLIYLIFSVYILPDGYGYVQEVGHFLAAFPKQVNLSIPFFIPNITLGSFGAITQVDYLIFHVSHVYIEFATTVFWYCNTCL